jgi:heterodisulfide reductase subunit B
MMFYEPKEDQRMGVKRVQMAAEAGANVIVTACPFCMVNIEDAIKVAGMEGKMTAIDLAELVDQQIASGVEAKTNSVLDKSISCHPEHSGGPAVLAGTTADSSSLRASE